MKGLNNEVYLSVHWFVQRTLKVDGAARQKMWQIEIEMNAQQEKADLVGISYVDCLLTTHGLCRMHFVPRKSAITEKCTILRT